MSTDRADADVSPPEVAGQQREAGETADDINRLAELGYAHSPHNGGGRGGGEGAHRPANGQRRDADQCFHGFGRVVFHRLTIGLQPFGITLNVIVIVEIFFQQDIGEGVDQRHIAAVVELQMLVGDAGGFNAPRIADDDFRAVVAGSQYPSRHDRVRIGAVIAKDQQTF